jgi:hypothetical protein
MEAERIAVHVPAAQADRKARLIVMAEWKAARDAPASPAATSQTPAAIPRPATSNPTPAPATSAPLQWQPPPSFPVITDKASYDALPPGSKYLRDGVLKVKA